MNSLLPVTTRRPFLVWTGALAATRICPAFGVGTKEIAPQPYFASVNRALEALAKLGAPLAAEDVQRLSALGHQNDQAAVEAAEAILERCTLMRVVADADGYAYVAVGGAQRILVERGWRPFLVRGANPIGTTARLTVERGSRSVTSNSTGASRAGVLDTDILAPDIERASLQSEMYEAPPLGTALSGAPMEYRVVELYSHNRGQRAAVLNSFTTGYPTEANAWLAKQIRRGDQFNFEYLPSRDIALSRPVAKPNARFMDAWCQQGPSHHIALGLGDRSQELRTFADAIGFACVEI